MNAVSRSSSEENILPMRVGYQKSTRLRNRRPLHAAQLHIADLQLQRAFDDRQETVAGIGERDLKRAGLVVGRGEAGVRQAGRARPGRSSARNRPVEGPARRGARWRFEGADNACSRG